MNKINLLVVEDDNNTVEEYKTDIKGFENFYLVGTTNKMILYIKHCDFHWKIKFPNRSGSDFLMQWMKNINNISLCKTVIVDFCHL